MEELLVKPASMPELHKTVEEGAYYMSPHVCSVGIRRGLTKPSMWASQPGVDVKDSLSISKMQKLRKKVPISGSTGPSSMLVRGRNSN